jgi:tetratricopeptide (TPR) repeat protein
MTLGMIRFLLESLPGVEMDAVVLDEHVTDPLQVVLDQLSAERQGPIMIVGLEKAVHSDQPEHPVLFNLNLSRPEWPRKLPRPVVLWVPEYVLALLGREAPDFLDWRSDTVYFLEQPALPQASPELWMDILWDRMPEPLRRQRIEELRSRILQWGEKSDPLTYSGWLRELGDHLSILGDFKEAERQYLAGLAAAEAAGEGPTLSLFYARLHKLCNNQGRDSESVEYLQKFFETGGASLDEPKEAIFASIISTIHDPEQDDLTEENLRLLLDYFRQTNNWEAASSLLYSLGFLLFRRGKITEAEHVLLEALEIEDRWGRSSDMGEQLRLLGDIYIAKGDLERAEGVLMQSLAIGQELGNRMGVASSYLDLGSLFKLRGDLNEAADALTKANAIFSEIGASPRRELAEKLLQELTLATQVSPSEVSEDTALGSGATTEPH